LEIVRQIEPVSFTWKIKEKTKDFGVIAEQINEILPHLVVKNSDGECQGVDYSRIVPFLIAAIQEQDKVISNLRQRITKLEHR
jgi:hypothetical protein